MTEQEMVNRSENAKEINEKIRGMSYRPEEILVFNGESVSSFVPRSGKMEADKFVVVTKTRHDVSGKYDIAVPNASKDITYPGALLLANQKLVEGTPDPLVVKRRPMRITIDLPGLTEDNSVLIEKNNHSGVTKGVNELLENWLEKKSGHYKIASNMQYKKGILYDEKSMQLKFGCDVEYMQNKLGIDFSSITEQESSAYLIQFKQIYYTVSAELPEAPADVMADEVSWEELRQKTDSQNPPCYVQNVQYGREIYLLLTSDMSSSELEAHMDANVKLSDGNVHVNGDAESRNKNKKIDCTMIALGGKPIMVNGSMEDDKIIRQLNELICENVELSAENPAFPISYTVAFLKDNRVAAIQGKTEYITSKFTEYSSGILNLKHTGAYVARFHVSWEEFTYDENGEEVVSRHDWQDNGHQITAPYSTSISLPANARKIHIKAEGATGLLWEKWRTSIDQTFPLISKRTVSISGTTLSQNADVSG